MIQLTRPNRVRVGGGDQFDPLLLVGEEAKILCVNDLPVEVIIIFVIAKNQAIFRIDIVTSIASVDDQLEIRCGI